MEELATNKEENDAKNTKCNDYYEAPADNLCQK